MLKKIMILGASIAALVAIATPAAQAIELKEGGTKLAAGAKITATSTNLELVITGIGTIKCGQTTIHGEVVKNGPTEVHVSGLGEATTSGCSLPTTDVTYSTISINNGDKGTATGVQFTADALNCTFSGSLNMEATTSTDLLHVLATTVGGTGPCSGGSHTIGTFTLETSSGVPVEWR